jgi:hypothetical protein
MFEPCSLIFCLCPSWTAECSGSLPWNKYYSFWIWNSKRKDSSISNAPTKLKRDTRSYTKVIQGPPQSYPKKMNECLERLLGARRTKPTGESTVGRSIIHVIAWPTPLVARRVANCSPWHGWHGPRGLKIALQRCLTLKIALFNGLGGKQNFGDMVSFKSQVSADFGVFERRIHFRVTSATFCPCPP